MVEAIMDAPHDEGKRPTASQHWWREWELGLLVALVLVVYFSRLTTLTIRGEESRRGLVAREMLQTNAWIVPRLQGNPFFMSSRPPLQNWAIALIGYLRGEVDVLAVRLPSAMALLALVVIIYAYSRTCLSRTGALAAGAAYATFGQVLELGRLGETDLLFTLFASGSLLLWHAGYSRNWPAAATWGVGYLFAALATLTKGAQAPIYFAASVGTYLLWTRNWRYALRWAHVAGVAVFLMVWGSWQLPFFKQAGFEGVRHVYLGDVRMYGTDRTLAHVLRHLVVYPSTILCGCLMPWSALLLCYARRDFRKRIGAALDNVRFLSCSIAVTFPTVWFVTDARTRFYMPLYPCFAVLVGLAVQRCLEAEPQDELRKLWSRLLTVMAGIMLLAGVGVFGATLTDDGSSPVGQPAWFAFVFLASTGLFAWTAIRARYVNGRLQAAAGIMTIAAFMGLTFAGVFTNVLDRVSLDRRAQVARLKQKLPEGVRLYSLGNVDHGLAFEFGKPVARCEWPGPEAELPPEVEYFCFPFDIKHASKLLSFPWETVAVISSSRNRGIDELEHLTVVGRRLRSGAVHDFGNVIGDYRAANDPGGRTVAPILRADTDRQAWW